MVTTAMAYALRRKVISFETCGEETLNQRRWIHPEQADV